MRRKIWKLMIAMLVLALLAGTVPAMAAEEEDGLSLFGGMGEGVNGLGAANENAEPVGDLIALDDLDISVRASDYTAVRQDEDEFVYIYTMEDGSIPYVLIGKYDFTSDDFTDQFTEYLASVYSDLQVEQDATPLTLGGGKEFTLMVYSYAISGYDAIDIRLFREFNGATYMFATKAVTELGMALPNGYIEQVAGSMEILAGGDGDYPLHVDSTRSIEPSLGGKIDTPDESGYDVSARDSFREISYDVSSDWTRFDVPSDWARFTDPSKNASLIDYSAVDYNSGSITISIESEAVPAGSASITDMTASEQMEVLHYLKDRYLINGSQDEEACDIAGVAGLQVKTTVSVDDGDHAAMHYFFFASRYYYHITFSDASGKINEELQNVISQFLSSIKIDQ